MEPVATNQERRHRPRPPSIWLADVNHAAPAGVFYAQRFVNRLVDHLEARHLGPWKTAKQPSGYSCTRTRALA